MKLKDWLALSGISQTEFGERIGVTGAAVSTYTLESSIPRKETMQRIAEETKGAVQPADFYQ
jgi:transcriptional regulator with XRE-family HTH domain